MKKWHTGSVRVWQAMGAGTLVTWVAVSCSSPDRRFSQGEGGEDSLGGNSGTSAGHSGRGGVSGSAGRRDDTAGEAPVPDPDGGSSGSSDDAAGSGGVLDMAGAGGDGATTAGTSGTAGSETSAGAGGAGDVTPPSVVSVTPTGTGVVKSASIVVKFSESMKASAASSVTLSSGGAGVALGAGLWSANDTTLTLQPTSELAYAIGEDPLTAMSFTISVQTSARDAAGNALAAAYTSSFSTLRRLQTLVTATEQTSYFAAESEYASGAGATFNVIRQVGGGGWEDQYTYGLVGFPKTNTTLTGAPANAESVALELYAGNALSGATLTFSHINSGDLTNVYTTLGAPKPTTAIALSSFPAANTWWSVDITPVVKHASFNLASYYSLQFLISMEAASGTAAGVSKTVGFAGGTSTSNKPRIRVTRLIP